MKTILLDYGHGGMLRGQYQTAPKKMYHFDNGITAYEGVINRAVGKKALKLMEHEGIHVIPICHTNVDVPLPARTTIINEYSRRYDCVLISLHANAGKGSGFEIWTSPGETASDAYATKFFDMYRARFPHQKMRKDMVDGDPDKESAFWILVNSACPAILPEWGFFDNWEDYKFMMEVYNQIQYADMIMKFAKSVQ
jgi:N-acetylmuramoyl-L-alanine amidase